MKPIDRKRSDNLSWDEYFMAIALLSADRSKDPVTQVGACIVDPDKRITSVGYNGMPTGCSDDKLPWRKQADNQLDSKYMYSIHAEANAILNRNAVDLKGCTLYTDLFPCHNCAKFIIQSGIRTVVYKRDKYAGEESAIAARNMMSMAGVQMTPFTCDRKKSITINLQTE